MTQTTSEFTKKAREINNTENVPKWLVRRTLGEACDVIDKKDELLFAYESVRAPKKPPVSNFTIDCTKKYMYHWKGCPWDEPCGKAFKEACVRLDASEAREKELLELLQH